jgi:cytochrome P450
MKGVPGPSIWESFSVLFRLRKNYVEEVSQLHKRYGSIFRLLLPKRMLFFCDPDHIQQFLEENQSNYRKSDQYKELIPLLGSGLLLSEGNYHHKQQRIVSSEFTFNRKKHFAEVTRNKLENVIKEKWDPAAERYDTIDVAEDIAALTFQIVAQAFMGIELKEEVSKAAQDFREAQTQAHIRMDKLIKFPYWFPTPGNLKALRAISRLDELVYKIIEEEEIKLSADHQNFLTRLLTKHKQEPDKLTKKEIRNEIMTLLLAGHETTSNAISWTLYLLAKHPQCLEKLRMEIDKNVGQRLPKYEDIEKLEYTKNAFLESMRLYPPAALLSRNSIDKDRIGNIDIPPNTIVFASTFVTYRLEKYWGDRSDEYMPERFFSTELDGRLKHHMAFFPFGAGMRKCIGQQFAEVEAMLIIATFVQRYAYRLSPKHCHELLTSVTIKPKHGVLIEIAPRKIQSPIDLSKNS